MNRNRFLVPLVMLIIAITGGGLYTYRDWILGVIERTSVPEMSYFIFGILALGCLLAMMHALRIRREDVLMNAFFTEWRKGDNQGFETARGLLEAARSTSKSDMVHVLEYVSNLNGRMPSSVQHSAVDAELTRFRSLQFRRLSFSQYLIGTSVGVGLLGTFVGLLGALAEISVMIQGFTAASVDDSTAEAIANLVQQLTKPLAQMGVAFATSLFGVLTSLILGVMMTNIRGAASDLASGLQSRVAISQDFAAANFEGVGGELDTRQLGEAFSSFSNDLLSSGKVLAEVALRFDGLMARIEEVYRLNGSIAGMLQKQLQNSAAREQLLVDLREDFSRMLNTQNGLLSEQRAVVTSVDAHRGALTEFFGILETMFGSFTEQQRNYLRWQESFWGEFNSRFNGFSQQQEQFWGEALSRNEIATSNTRKFIQDASVAIAQQVEASTLQHREIMAMHRKEINERGEEDREFWTTFFRQMETDLNLARKRHEELVASDRKVWQDQFQSQQDALGLMRKAAVDRFEQENEILKQLHAERQQSFTEAIKALQEEAGRERNVRTQQIEASTLQHREIMAMHRKEINQRSEEDREFWTTFFRQMETDLNLARKRHEELVASDRKVWQDQFQSQQDALGLMRKAAVDRFEQENEILKQLHAERQQSFTEAIKALQEEAGRERNVWNDKGGQLIKMMGSSQESLRIYVEQVADYLSQQSTRMLQVQDSTEATQRRLLEINEESTRFLTLIADSIRSDASISAEAQRKIEGEIQRLVAHNMAAFDRLITTNERAD